MAQAQYDYQPVDYPGGTDTQVFGINERGDVVGNGSVAPDTFPFVFTSKNGNFINVAPLAGYASTAVLGINDAGVMVGSVLSLDETTTSGFIRDNKGNFTLFSHPDAVSNTTARGINNKGLVTGTRDTSDGFLAGFLYDPKAGTFTDLVPSILTIAHGINSKGSVAGDARFEVDPCGGLNAFERYGWVRAKDGSTVLFQVNGERTVARGISDSGFITGNVLDPSTNELKGFVIKAPTENCEPIPVDASELLQFPASEATFPEGITNSGDIVGIYFDASDSSRGFIASPQ